MFFKKKRIDFESESLSAQTWRRFKRNKLSMLGLVIIFISCVISILGYLITPDHTPYANDQKPELHIKEPGFHSRFLLVKKNEVYQEPSLLDKMLFGVYVDKTSLTIAVVPLQSSNTNV